MKKTGEGSSVNKGFQERRRRREVDGRMKTDKCRRRSHSFKQNCPERARADGEQASKAEPGRGLGLETPATIESRGTNGANNEDGISTLQPPPGLRS